MKKFLTKVLPIALVVLAICMTSVSAFAATGVYEDGVVTVTTDDAATETTILATRQDGSGADNDLTNEDVWGTIVYIDQAATASFNFAPRANIEGDTITVFLGTAGASEIEKIDVELETVAVDRTLSLIVDGEALADAPTVYPAEGMTLPTPAKAGYTFSGWYANAELTGDAETTIAADAEGAKTFYGAWTLNATVASDAGYCAETADADEIETGVISVTASFGSHITNITEVGFYVYRTETAEAERIKISAEIAVSDFYTVVYGIPADEFDTEVIILPYVVADQGVVYGTTEEYTVNNAVNGQLKYLGTLDNLLAQLN